MRERCILIGGALLVGGCANDDTPPSAYKNPLDQVTVALGIGSWTCYRKEDGAYAFVGYDQCYRFKEPQRMRGVWIDEFEAPALCPANMI